jgi:hypothetical protein
MIQLNAIQLFISYMVTSHHYDQLQRQHRSIKNMH